MSQLRLCIAIMAGGHGTRLWPRSTADSPKPFRRFFGQSPFLSQTLDRTVLLAPPDQTYVLIGRRHLDQAASLAPTGIRLIREPCGRSTAACAGLAALHAERDHPGSLLVLLPSDHWIDDSGAFARTIREAAAAADNTMVTIGVQPTSPQPGYGYIKLADEPAVGPLRASGFREKPCVEEASRLIAAGALWNTGIYVVRAAELLRLIRQHLPLLGEGLDRIAPAIGTPEEETVTAEVYEQIQPISIDHGIAEKLDHFLVIPAQFQWDDMGTWTACAKLQPRDSDGNVTAGPLFALESTGCVVDAPELHVALIGVRDLIVAREGNHLLICDQAYAQAVREAAAAPDDVARADDP